MLDESYRRITTSFDTVETPLNCQETNVFITFLRMNLHHGNLPDATSELCHISLPSFLFCFSLTSHKIRLSI